MTDPVDDYARGPVNPGNGGFAMGFKPPPPGDRRPVSRQRKALNEYNISGLDAVTEPADDYATGPVVFANPESCTLGPVKLAEILSALKPFAERHRDMDANMRAAGLYADCEAARDLYLKLGGGL